MPGMRFLLLPLLALCALPVHAIHVCELDGQFINPANGNMTAGKTGLMRCREGADGPVVREQELRNGVFMGIVRYYQGGLLKSEHNVNERGNRDGLAREFTGKQLTSEQTYRNGSTVGLSRRWHENGQPQRLTFYGDDGREQAVAEFTRQGKLANLRCAAQPQLAPDADDATWCGHRGGTSKVTLYAENGSTRGTLAFERGELRQSENLWSNGKPREQVDSDARGGTERSFTDSGAKRSERQWVNVTTDGRTRRITTLDREYHESGTLVRERQWAANERDSRLRLEQRWYLNGQLKEKQEYVAVDGQATRRETYFHDNGRVSSEGLWLVSGRYNSQASGVHKSYDSDGRLRLERYHDAKGRVTREREFDDAGQVKRDDELFEDGSRKAFQAR
jgi:antitoxin component YwqK of YwqJK toxin-antitoxin module